MARLKIAPLKTKAQWDALASAARIEIVQLLRISGPCSIRELAELVHRPVPSLYFHVRKLQRAGLVVQRGLRKARRQTEALYDLAAQRFVPDVDAASGRNVRELQALLRTLLRFTERQTLRAVAQGVQPEGPTVAMGRRTGWLTARQARRIAQMVTRAGHLVERGHKTSASRLHALTVVFIPVPPRRGDWQ